MSKIVRLNKVPISSLLEVLTQLFEEGVDYIDLEGHSKSKGENDMLKITVRPEYYSNEPDLEIEIEQQIRKTDSLSDEDINDLI